jgi:hypothetical protein
MSLSSVEPLPVVNLAMFAVLLSGYFALILFAIWLIQRRQAKKQSRDDNPK